MNHPIERLLDALALAQIAGLVTDEECDVCHDFGRVPASDTEMTLCRYCGAAEAYGWTSDADLPSLRVRLR